PEGCALADDVFKAVLRADFWFEIELIGFEPAHVGKTGCSEVSEVCESNGRAHNLLLMVQFVFWPPDVRRFAFAPLEIRAPVRVAAEAPTSRPFGSELECRTQSRLPCWYSLFNLLGLNS